MASITYACPGCDEPFEPTPRQIKALEAGRQAFHNRECQSNASRETRPCDACGTPVTRRRSGFGGGKVACSTECRGRLKALKQEIPCEVCSKPVLRVPDSGRVFCSRKCFGLASRNLERATATCAREECARVFEVSGNQAERAAEGKPVYCSKQCRHDDTHVALPCEHCGTPVERYKSQMKGRASTRVFCGPCRDGGGVGFKPRKGSTKPCGTCGQPVYRVPSQDDGGPRYCSEECWGGSLKGERVERVERPCEVCGEMMRLEPDQIRQNVRTCGRDCTNVLRRRKPGERYVEPSGYVKITTPDGRNMFEHRWVMEQHIGRRLLPAETVHHKKGGFAGRSNNSLENLELWTGRHPKGHRVEDVVEYCREMLAMYGDVGEAARYAGLREKVAEDADEASPAPEGD